VARRDGGAGAAGGERAMGGAGGRCVKKWIAKCGSVWRGRILQRVAAGCEGLRLRQRGAHRRG